MLAMERFPHPTTGGGAPRPGEKDRYDLAVRLARRYFVVPFVVGCAVALGLSTGVRPPPRGCLRPEAGPYPTPV